jgi:AraC-like DNA-binding protein
MPFAGAFADGHTDGNFVIFDEVNRQKQRSIAQLLDALPEPDDYFEGLRRPAEPLPDNVLLFTRTEDRHLRAAQAASAFHQRWVLIMALRGAGTVERDRVPCRLSPGAALLVPPLHLHAYTDVARRPCWLFVTFDWPGHTALDEGWRGVAGLTAAARERLRLLIPTCRAARPDGLMAAAHLLLLLRELFPKAQAEAHPEKGLIAEVRAAALAAPEGRLGSLARKMGISESHLRSRFRSEAGISLGRYLREARLRQAAVWLREDDLTVKAAAERAGYPDVYSFSRAFKRALGSPPSRMKNKSTGEAR